MIKRIYLFLYYSILYHISMQPMPGYKIDYYLRRVIAQKLLKKYGTNIIVKNHFCFGKAIVLQ